MAEVLGLDIFRKLELNVAVKSRGVAVFGRGCAAANACDAVKKYGLNLDNHTAAQISDEDMAWADVILTMTNSHKKILQDGYANYSEKIFTLKEFGGDSGDIADPFGMDLDSYEWCLEEMKISIDAVGAKLK